MNERNSHVAEPFRQIINDISAGVTRNSTDIVERLRKRIIFQNDADALEAANEIERLRGERDNLYGHVNDLLGLLVLVSSRDDMPAAIRDDLETSFRAVEASAYVKQIAAPIEKSAAA